MLYYPLFVELVSGGNITAMYRTLQTFQSTFLDIAVKMTDLLRGNEAESRQWELRLRMLEEKFAELNYQIQSCGTPQFRDEKMLEILGFLQALMVGAQATLKLNEGPDEQWVVTA